VSLTLQLVQVVFLRNLLPPRVQQFSITFDALLVGHEAGVTSLRWQPTDASATVPALLSTSTDSSLTLWSPSVLSESSEDGSSSIWISQQRFGDIGGQRLGGFVCGLWGMGGREVLAAGWGGGWRRWRCTGESSQADDRWFEIPGISGHRGPVKGLDWSPQGEYLISSG
jgi:elongator complex protein 2